MLSGIPRCSVTRVDRHLEWHCPLVHQVVSFFLMLCGLGFAQVIDSQEQYFRGGEWREGLGSWCNGQNFFFLAHHSFQQGCHDGPLTWPWMDATLCLLQSRSALLSDPCVSFDLDTT